MDLGHWIGIGWFRETRGGPGRRLLAGDYFRGGVSPEMTELRAPGSDLDDVKP
jgi:hypothetical protein